MLSDDPVKGLGRAPEERPAVATPARGDFRAPMRELSWSRPTSCRERRSSRRWRFIARQGVKVAVLTNALEATDVAVVHAGYAKRRKALLAAGITLFELKRGSSGLQERVGWTGRSGSGSQGPACMPRRSLWTVSRVFVGSFNFDPRSARLNTEMGS